MRFFRLILETTAVEVMQSRMVELCQKQVGVSSLLEVEHFMGFEGLTSQVSALLKLYQISHTEKMMT
jgi:hypothetical protein